jgi:hypothetical protein
MKGQDFKGEDNSFEKEGLHPPSTHNHHSICGIAIAAKDQGVDAMGITSRGGEREGVHGSASGGLDHQDRISKAE